MKKEEIKKEYIETNVWEDMFIEAQKEGGSYCEKLDRYIALCERYEELRA